MTDITVMTIDEVMNTVARCARHGFLIKRFKVKRKDLIKIWIDWQLPWRPGTGYVSFEDFEKSVMSGEATWIGKPIKVIE